MKIALTLFCTAQLALLSAAIPVETTTTPLWRVSTHSGQPLDTSQVSSSGQNLDFEQLLPLQIDPVPSPPARLFTQPAADDGAHVISRKFSNFFHRLQNLVLKQGFDEISFASNIDSISSEHAVLNRIANAGILSPGEWRIFEFSSYLFQLMKIYHQLLQGGVVGAISKECTGCVLLLMRELEFEMSLMTYVDNTGRFNLSSDNDNPQVTLSIIIDTFNDLESHFTNPLMPKLRDFGALRSQHKKLAWMVEEIKNTVHGDIPEDLSTEETLLSARDKIDVGLESISQTRIAEISRNIEKLRNITADAKLLLSKSSCVDLPLFDSWICLFAFEYENSGPDALKWTNLEIPEVKELHDMLHELHKKLDHLQEVYLWRKSHETDIQSTTTMSAANSDASNLLDANVVIETSLPTVIPGESTDSSVDKLITNSILQE
ncbi:hypothetical protein OXX80_008567 [Metschnikowia pulcherrima]